MDRLAKQQNGKPSLPLMTYTPPATYSPSPSPVIPLPVGWSRSEKLS